MGAVGWIAFVLVLLLAIGIGIPGIANGVAKGFETVVHSPVVAQVVGAIHGMLGSIASSASTHS